MTDASDTTAMPGAVTEEDKPPSQQHGHKMDQAKAKGRALVGKAKDLEHRLVADGACCAQFPSFIGPFAKQLHGCMQHHHLTDEEKTGLLWFRAADKGCGGFGSAHHCFLAWLSIAVWLEFICGVTFFVLVFLEDGVVTAGSETVPSRATPAEIFIFTGIQLGLCYLWNYVGYWAFETKNGPWCVLYLVGQLLWSLSLLLSSFGSFELMGGLSMNIKVPTGVSQGVVAFEDKEVEIVPSAPIFIITGIGYLLTFVAVIHVLLFGAISLSKLHHGGTNATPAREKLSGGDEEQPIKPLGAQGP